MTLLVVSDEVSRFLYQVPIREHLADVELIVSCGDLPYEYLEFLVSILNVPLVYVLGNHDAELILEGGEELVEPRGGINLDGRTVEINGRDGGSLLLGGLEGSMRYSGRGHEYTESHMRWKVWRMLPRLLWNRWTRGRAIDILITHAPPAGVHDGPDLPHWGFRAFHTILRRFQPQYHIHGHTHERYGFGTKAERVDGTDVINVTGYCVLEVDLVHEHGADPGLPEGETARVLPSDPVDGQAGADAASVLRARQGASRHQRPHLHRPPRSRRR